MSLRVGGTAALLSVVAVAASAQQPADDPAFRAFAAEVQKSVEAGDGGFFGRYADPDAFVQASTQGLGASPEQTRMMRKSTSDWSIFSGSVAQAVAGGGSYKVLRFRSGPGGRPHAIFRMLPRGGGLNYHEYALRKDPSGAVKVVDIRIFSSGEWHTETMRRGWVMALAADTPLARLGSLVGVGNDFARSIPQMEEMLRANKEGRAADALAAWRKLPPSVQTSKHMLLTRMAIAERVSEREMEEAIDALARQYPGDPGLSLLLLDSYQKNRQFDQAIAAVDAIRREVGGDAYLDYLHGGYLFHKGDLPGARAALQQAIRVEPLLPDPYWALLQIAVTEKDYPEAVRVMDTLVRGGQSVDVARVDPSGGLAQSAAYKGWAAGGGGPAAAPPAPAPAAPPAAQGPDPDLARGIQQVQQGHHEDALTTLNGVVQRLSSAGGRQRELAQAHLWLGLAYGHLDLEKSARASFGEALRLDPSVSLAEGWPSKVARAFAAVREGSAPRAQATPAPAPARAPVPAPTPSSLSSSASVANAVPEDLERAGRTAEAEAAYRKAAQSRPSDAAACQAHAAFLIRTSPARFDETIAVLERCAAISPRDPAGYQKLATLYWDKTYRDPSLSRERRVLYTDLGLVNVNKALKIKPDSVEGLVYKGLLLRLKAREEKDPGKQEELMKEATRLQDQSRALMAKNDPGFEERYEQTMRERAAARGQGGVTGGVEGGVVGGVVGGLPPAPPPPSGPVRVGGQIREPKRLKYVEPVYPSIAQAARVQGVVILECTIGPDGRVSEVKVLRGIPLLDEAAIESVKQSVYSPTLLNGVPVPVIMTVTVNFSLQ